MSLRTFICWVKKRFVRNDVVIEREPAPVCPPDENVELPLRLSKGAVSLASAQLFAANRNPSAYIARRPTAEQWAGIRQEVFQRDDWRCQVTGCVNVNSDLECHHIHPVAQGGGHGLDNLVTLCLFHHACQKDHDVRSMKKRTGSRYWIRPGHWRDGKWIGCGFGRKIFVSGEDLKMARSIYQLCCRCGHPDWVGYLRPKLDDLIILCPECLQGWKLPLGVREETCVALAHVLVPTKNQGRVLLADFKDNVMGLRTEAVPIKACPYCFIESESRKCGFLVPQRGPYGPLLRCTNFSVPTIRCRYMAHLQ